MGESGIYNILLYFINLFLIILAIYLIVVFIKSKDKNYSILIVGIVFTISGLLFFIGKFNAFINTNANLKWNLYRDVEGNFSALFPGKITKEEKNKSNGHFVEIMSDLTKQKIIFVIDYSKNSNNENIIKANNDNYLNDGDYVILDKKQSMKNEYIIFDYTMISKDKKWDLKIRYIYNKSILYIISIFGRQINENDAKIFFDSFHILK